MGGFGVGEFEVALKLAFVQAAAVEGRTKGGRTNVSRIAAMTGMTRKEVRQLLHILEDDGRLVAPSMSRQRTARVLEAWRTDPLYLDERGRPRVLPSMGDEPSFQSLVRAHGGDVTPTSVLRELERTGAVRVQADGTVRCRSSTTASGPADTAFLLEYARRLQEFATAMAAGTEPGERHVYYGFREAAVALPDLARLFHTTFADRASNLLSGADRWVAGRQRQRAPASEAPPPSSTTLRLGVFLSDSQRLHVAPPALRPRRAAPRG